MPVIEKTALSLCKKLLPLQTSRKQSLMSFPAFEKRIFNVQAWVKSYIIKMKREQNDCNIGAVEWTSSAKF